MDFCYCPNPALNADLACALCAGQNFYVPPPDESLRREEAEIRTVQRGKEELLRERKRLEASAAAWRRKLEAKKAGRNV